VASEAKNVVFNLVWSVCNDDLAAELHHIAYGPTHRPHIHQVAMASPIAAVKPLQASSKRVLRNITTIQDFIAAYPTLLAGLQGSLQKN
jgi:hypothetical protein